jgi:hypothetical protein
MVPAISVAGFVKNAHQEANVLRGHLIDAIMPAGELWEEVLVLVAHDDNGRDGFDRTPPNCILNQLPLPRPQERPPHAAGDDEEAFVALTVHIYHWCTVWPFNVCLQVYATCKQTCPLAPTH